MIHVLQTRLMHWKKQWLSLIFWLVLPVGLTFIIIHATSSIQEDAKVPVGIVVEDNSDSAVSLVNSLEDSPLIRVIELDKQDALHQLQKHELDSVFIIPEGYSEQIRKGSRNRLVIGYTSDLSLAYSPVKELFLSYVQQDTARSMAAYTVKQISEAYPTDHEWTWDEIVQKSIAIQDEEDLIHTKFSFLHAASPSEESDLQLWKTWGLWSIFALLSTLLLFDWVIKETRTDVIRRFTFMRISLMRYLVTTLFFYLGLFLIIDIATMFIFHHFLGESISFNLLYSLLFYRCTLTIGAFLLANIFKNTYVFYSLSFVITIIAAIISGAIFPIDGITNHISWIEYINPIHAFLVGKTNYICLLFLILWGVIWYFRKGKINA